MDGCVSAASIPIAITVNNRPAPPIITTEGGSLNHCLGNNVKLIAGGCDGTVSWSNGETGQSITIAVTAGVSYHATCLKNNCQSILSNSIAFTCIQAGSKIKTINLDFKVILEGPYNPVTGLMNTKYNAQGLLPGQTPVSQFGVATPPGQPYKRIPWNYNGTESLTTYAATIVDWILISLKNEQNEILYQTAALLHADAPVELVHDYPQLDTTQTYFVQIDHRNHLGVKSINKLAVVNSKITHNFSVVDSYIKPNTPAFGQKLIGSTYVMFVGDIDKSSSSQHYDINFADITQLRNKVGFFEQYLDADINLDADVNFNDLIIWRANSGKFSSITY